MRVCTWSLVVRSKYFFSVLIPYIARSTQRQTDKMSYQTCKDGHRGPPGQGAGGSRASPGGSGSVSADLPFLITTIRRDSGRAVSCVFPIPTYVVRPARQARPGPRLSRPWSIGVWNVASQCNDGELNKHTMLALLRGGGSAMGRWEIGQIAPFRGRRPLVLSLPTLSAGAGAGMHL